MRATHWLIGLLGINIVIAVHELGHWSMAQLFGVATPEFSIGFGPKILEKRIGSTNFALAALPIGGFVEIEGMRHVEPGKEAISFAPQPFKNKVLIMLGGIIFNIIFAFIIFIVVGFPPPMTSHSELPEKQSVTSKGHQKFFGPLGIIGLASRSLQYGLRFYVYFLAILSLNLAIFNLFPIPILDGGQLLLLTLEAARGAPLPEAVFQLLMTLTTLLMLLLLIHVTRQDIRNA